MQYFITSTGTDIGKTFITTKICRDLIKKGQKVSALKPIISGFRDDDLESDSAKILQSLGLKININNIEAISPYRFKAPLSPNIAAKLENKEINFHKVVDFCSSEIVQAKKNNQYLFIEGAGGIMSPVSNDRLFIDLISNLKIPVILVVGNYLGTISHTLTAIKSMQSENIRISQVIINIRDDNEINIQDTIKMLKDFTDVNIFTNLQDLRLDF